MSLPSGRTISQNHLQKHFNSLTNNKIVDWSNLKESADDKIYVTEKWKFVLGRVENILGKGENAGYQLFGIKAIFSL